MISQIQIHYRKPDGRTGVMNYLSSDNAEAYSGRFGRSEENAREALRERAKKMAATWATIFPDDEIFVVET